MAARRALWLCRTRCLIGLIGIGGIGGLGGLIGPQAQAQVQARNGDAAAPMLTLYYYERPPFHSTDEHGQVSGTIASATEDTLRRAKIPFHWVPMPANRVLATLRTETVPACSPGWYDTPERRADFQLSKATLLDKPLIALVRADFAVPPGVSAKAFFAMPHVRLLVKQNFSQGAYMNELIAQMPAARVQKVSLAVPNMVQMLRADRADVIITTEAEAGLFVHAAGFSMSEFKIIRFPDVPAQEFRYMLCDRAVSAATMAQIDNAIVLQKP